MLGRDLTPTLSIVLTAAVLAGCGRPTASPVPTVRPVSLADLPSCTAGQTTAYTTEGIEHFSDGRLVGCLRVGSLPPGNDVLALETLEKPVVDLGVRNSANWMRVTPSSGPPGTLVTVTGFVSGTTQEQRLSDRGRVCWDGCQGPMELVPIHWSADQHGQFQLQFQAPQTAWLGTRGVHPLEPGTYDVVLPCIPDVIFKDFAHCESSTLSATFRLTGPGDPRCAPRNSCAVLAASPTDGPPGALVTVRGWAPLVGIGADDFLTLEIIGNGTTPFVGVRLASISFRVTAAPASSAIATLAPRWIQRSGMDEIAMDPINSQRLGFCADGSILVTTDAGRTWRAIPLAGVAGASAATDYPVPSLNEPRISCVGMALDAGHPDSFYTTFSTVPRGSYPPPAYFVGYATSTAGRTWRPVPVPAGSDMGSFGGFRALPDRVQALFFTPAGAGAGGARPFTVVETRDGARTWTSGALRCPTSGPCAQLGPQGNGRCMAVREVEDIELSTDGGKNWSATSWPDGASACTTSELIAFGDGGLALLDETSTYPLLVSRDAGLSWTAIGLPPFPQPPEGFAAPSGLGILPDGSLLSTGGGWFLLKSGASAWCAVANPPWQMNPGVSAPVVANGRLWALVPPSELHSMAPSSLQSYPLDRITCASRG